MAKDIRCREFDSRRINEPPYFLLPCDAPHRDSWGHFTPGSLSSLLVKCGFEVIALKRHPSSYVRNALKTIPVVGLFRNLVCLFYAGRDFTLVARKAA